MTTHATHTPDDCAHRAAVAIHKYMKTTRNRRRIDGGLNIDHPLLIDDMATIIREQTAAPETAAQRDELLAERDELLAKLAVMESILNAEQTIREVKSILESVGKDIHAFKTRCKEGQ